MAAPTPSAKDLHRTMTAAFQEADVAERYSNAENATRPFCKIMVEKSGLAHFHPEAHVFDLATGTGAAIQELYDAVPKEKWGNLKVLGGDVSPGMLEYLRKRGEREGWTGLETQVVDGAEIHLPENTYTHIFVSFGIFAMPDVLPKLWELLKPGGFIGISTWAQLPWQPLLARSIARMAEKAYSPSPSDLEAKMFAGRPWGDREYLASQLSAAGFKEVDTVRAENGAACGTPKLFMATMQFPLKLVVAYWEESKREAWLKELNGLMLEEVARDAGGEHGQVHMQFDANVGWGWKAT